MSSVTSAIEECRSQLQKRRTGLLTRLGLRSLPHTRVQASAEPLDRLLAALVKEADVSWAAVVMANNGIFVPGTDDLPGIVAVDAGHAFDVAPERLLEVADSVFALKSTDFEEVPDDQKAAAAQMQDELLGAPWLPVPTSLAGGEGVYLTKMTFLRRDLPGLRLNNRLLPVLSQPSATRVVRSLPPVFWTPGVKQVVDGKAEDGGQPDFTVTKSIDVRWGSDPQEIVRNEYRRRSAGGTVLLSERAVEEIRDIMQESELGDKSVIVEMTGGGRRLAFEEYDEAEHIRVPCDGLSVCVPRDSWAATAGVYIDFVSDEESRGFAYKEVD